MSSPPVPWIGMFVWRERENLQRYGGLGSYPQRAADGVPTIHDVEPLELLADAQATRMPVAEAPEVPRGTLEQLRSWIAHTPNVAAFWNPSSWPVCHERLARLIIVNPTPAELARLEAVAGPLDGIGVDVEAAAWAECIVALRGGDMCDGMNLFQCSECGRLAGVYSGT